MHKIAQLPVLDRRHIFTESAIEIGNIALITEKDFWVVWAMKHVFELGEISNQLIFRGGTSLSKAYSYIKRFSEDVDLGVDYKYFGFIDDRDPNNAPSKSQRIKLIKQFRRKIRQYMENDFKEMLSQSFGKVIIDEDWSIECQQDGRIIQFYFNYPRSLKKINYHSDYILPTVKIEIDPRASLEPLETKSISPIIADYFPDQFDEVGISINTLKAQRTFWEKVALLHRIFIGRDKLPKRFSRHCYDVAELSKTKSIQDSMENLELLKKVIEHNKKFYEQTDKNYLGAINGNIKLNPNANLIVELKNDYIETKNMIFGNEPDFDSIITALKEIENKINHCT